MTIRAARFAAIAVLACGAAGAFIIGPWNGDSQAEAEGRVFELRVYHTLPGRLPALESNFREHTVGLLKKHGITSIGYWRPQDAPESENTLIFILAHNSREAAARHWKEFQDDPEWREIVKASRADGEILAKVESTFMTPRDYSPLR